MQIEIDKNNIIEAFATNGGLMDGIEVAAWPDDFPVEKPEEFWPGGWRLEDDCIVVTGAKRPEDDPASGVPLDQQIADLQMAVVELYEEVLGNG